jgi:hypothetical protein
MDLLAKFGPLLGQVAPSIATALGGPLAGVAVRTLSGALFGHEEGTEQQVAEAIANATPEQLSAIKKIDADFKVRMKELDIDLERIAAGDRDSARQMQRETRDWLPKALAVFIVFGFFGILLWMMVFGLPKTGVEALLMMVGSLTSAFGGVVQFYFGSSAGSKEKNNLLAAKEK